MKKIRESLVYGAFITGIALLLIFSHFFDPAMFRYEADRFFENALENDALGLHFTLAEPERFGIHPADASLPVYSEQSRQDSIRAQKALLTRLSRLNPDRLNEQDRYAFDLLTSALRWIWKALPILFMKNLYPPLPEKQANFCFCSPNTSFSAILTLGHLLPALLRPGLSAGACRL